MINILFAGNDRMYDGLMISLLSLVKYCDAPVHAFIMTMDLTSENPNYTPVSAEHASALQQILREKNESSEVTLLDGAALYNRYLKGSPNAASAYTPYALLRLLADRMPEIPDKLLYLDTDTVFNADVRLLYDLDVSGCELASVKDYYGRWFFGPRYFNSGVMLLNMKRIRETGLFTRAAELCARKKIFLADQAALNRQVREKKLLPHRFNEQHKLKPDTVIRHFSMTIIWLPKFHTRNIKPWQIDDVHNILKTYEFDDIFEAYRERIAIPVQSSKKED